MLVSLLTSSQWHLFPIYCWLCLWKTNLFSHFLPALSATPKFIAESLTVAKLLTLHSKSPIPTTSELINLQSAPAEDALPGRECAPSLTAPLCLLWAIQTAVRSHHVSHSRCTGRVCHLMKTVLRTSKKGNLKSKALLVFFFFFFPLFPFPKRTCRSYNSAPQTTKTFDYH